MLSLGYVVIPAMVEMRKRLLLIVYSLHKTKKYEIVGEQPVTMRNQLWGSLYLVSGK